MTKIIITYKTREGIVLESIASKHNQRRNERTSFNSETGKTYSQDGLSPHFINLIRYEGGKSEGDFWEFK